MINKGVLMKVIDAHVHMGMNSFCENPKTELKYNLENKYEDYFRVFSSVDFYGACILPIPGLDYSSEKSNEYLLSSSKKSKGRFIPICRADNDLGYNLNNGFSGCKIHRVYDGQKESQYLEYCRLIELYEKPLILHAEFKDKIKQIRKLTRLFPRLKIILAHMGRGHIYTSENVLENAEEFKHNGNIFFETSTVGNSETISEVCRLVGSERIMFGTDYPFGKIWFGDNYRYEDELKVITNAKIKGHEKENILFYTANNIFAPITEKKVYITLYQKKYKEILEEIINSLSEEDKKFLALKYKTSILRECVRKEKHIYLIFYENEVVGFFRESGRPNGFYLIEELAISNRYRGKHIATDVLQQCKQMFPSHIIKTNGSNFIMNGILQKLGYVGDGKKIITWKYDKRVCSIK